MQALHTVYILRSLLALGTRGGANCHSTTGAVSDRKKSSLTDAMFGAYIVPFPSTNIHVSDHRSRVAQFRICHDMKLLIDTDFRVSMHVFDLLPRALCPTTSPRGRESMTKPVPISGTT